MGSQSDWPIMKHASDTLENLAINHEKKVVSAHRTPDLLFEYAESASVRGIEVIIAGAGGAARSASGGSGARLLWYQSFHLGDHARGSLRQSPGSWAKSAYQHMPTPIPCIDIRDFCFC